MLKANWILHSYKMGKVCPLFRKDFNVDKEIVSATLYITARGVYEATINGKRVGDFLWHPVGLLTTIAYRCSPMMQWNYCKKITL